jgi:hypothetical protein
VELKPDIAKMDASLRDMALGDVKRASKPGEDGTGGAKVAGFLLLSDTLGGDGGVVRRHAGW